MVNESLKNLIIYIGPQNQDSVNLNNTIWKLLIYTIFFTETYSADCPPKTSLPVIPWTSSCYSRLTEHEASTLNLQPILFRAAISASPHVRHIVLISFSTVLRQVAFGLPCFLFSWGVHLRAFLGILLWTSLKYVRATGDDAF